MMHESLRQSINESTNENQIQTGCTSLTKIQVENRSQGIGKSKPLLPVASTKVKKDVRPKDTQYKMNPPFVTEVNYNSIESAIESEGVMSSSRARYCNKTSMVQSIAKGKKCNVDNSGVVKKLSNPMKKHLWGGKSSKNRVALSNNLDKTKVEQDQNRLTEKALKLKKPATISSLKKLSRSSLTIESNKITINLSKYSPCASRLAASSKILSNSSITSPESPLCAVRLKSPSHINTEVERTLKPLEKMTIQASLSLNIQQFQKSNNLSPRSKSVGDSCVTSPTSEGTTMSYSPTGTEILSLEEVGLQVSVTEASQNGQQVKEMLDSECSNKVEKATLETMC